MIDKTGKLLSRGDVVSYTDFQNSRCYGRVLAIQLDTGEVYLEKLDFVLLPGSRCRVENPDKNLDTEPHQLYSKDAS